MESFKEEVVYDRFFQFNYTKEDDNKLRFMMKTLPNTILFDNCNFGTINDENTDVEDIPKDNKEVFSKWSGQETALLLANVDKYGNQWEKMDINGRTVSSIRNRWARLTSKHIKKGKNRCSKCGMLRRGHICKFK
jgi:hypothetical protein